MKKRINVAGCILIFLFGGIEVTEAQVLKGFGKRLEKKIEQRIDRKADRQVDRALDKAEKETDESIENALKKSPDTQLAFDPVESKPDQALVMVGNNCNDFSWFKKGSILEYEVLDGSGKSEGTTRMEVYNLRNEGASTIAEVKASLTTPHSGNLSYEMNYVCEGDKIYMDMGAMMKAMMENNPELKNQNEEARAAMENIEMDFSKDFASFPKRMYPGMELDDLTFTFKTHSSQGEMSFNTVINNRQVVARETISTNAGQFDCLKIRSVSNTSFNVMGFKKAMPPSVDYLWIAPNVGMVRQETHVKGAKTGSVELKTFSM